ncbi:hypothetical protein CC1G_01752 [Coprinopsis cinerea okayama7|uniref:Homeobox domain-containing protein n=1 Tax=Coprinopsis cinerea (strain Okayama-7 / 130 / ATCC MYA-4618 / FGSC 9003) TaxID=240176 RepID=A8N2B2_COPC7|nr:hypothetical protein CC1G_01752 [Coprinopsis cinerea okayama7\|eukprot:XP_001829072.2 hypothetical protein CC1G_01752 [Coprinopsis cinerea okayama7\
MTSVHSPLHFLAQVACDTVHPPTSPPCSPSPPPAPSSPADSWQSSASSMDLHIPCTAPDHILQPPQMQPLRHSTSSNSSHTSSDVSSPSPTRRKTAKRHSPDHLSQIKFKQQMRARRQMLMERAMRIKSLDNSPVNDHQLLVLRMVYDQITMYPPESWMVLLAIVIRRAFKQVKNWFSNERQKNKEGRSIRTQTKEGDKVRLRPMALQQWCPEWSDAFFEEVIMIYDYKVLMDLRLVSNDS